MKGLLILILLAFVTNLEAQTSYSKILAITTAVDATNGTINLKWDKISTASGYKISKKLRNSSSWTPLITLTTKNDTTYTDIIVNTEVGYEYQIVTTGIGIEASSSVYAAIDLPANHYAGRLILLIDSAYINYCSQEINQYLLDIVKEGWSYSIHYVDRSTPVAGVKQIIKTCYEQDPANTKGVFILGHIAIPYSGSIYPDGHTDHQGAWPADCFYADTPVSEWTDDSVNIVTASRPKNRNIPGDGKFDQDSIKVNIAKLFVARVDLFDMPAISSNDSLMIKNYLLKDHAYRSLQNKFRMRALVDDKIGYFGGEAFGQNGYRNGVTLLGKDSVMNAGYFSMNTIDNSYLWSYACGFGSYTSASGVGNTNSFKTSNVQSVFTMLFGSYFGDWDNSNNFLRAPLASNSAVLTNCWAGRPNWFFHAMGLGECIGFSAADQIKTPNMYQAANYGGGYIHAELLGDPTLKMYLYDPPENLNVTTTNNEIVNLTWTASVDSSVIGYYIYRSPSLSTPFTLLNQNAVAALSFADSTAPSGNNIYMVRAVKLQNTVSSGTFNNLSNGILDSIIILRPLPIQLVAFTLGVKNCNVDLQWNVSGEQNVEQYEVLFSTDGLHYTSLYKIDASNAGTYKTTHSQVCNLYDNKILYYKLKITDANGRFVFSNVITAKIKETYPLSISENPVINTLTIKGLEGTGSIRIIDIDGRLLYNQNVSSTIVNMTADFLQSGVYVLQYYNKDTSSTLKFIKK